MTQLQLKHFLYKDSEINDLIKKRK